MKKALTIVLSSLLILFIIRMTETAPIRTAVSESAGIEDIQSKGHINDLKIKKRSVKVETSVDLEDLEVEKESAFKIINISPRSLNEHTLADKSSFSKTYKLMTEVKLDNKGSFFRIELDEPIENVISIVIVGGAGEGESGLSGISVNGAKMSKEMNALEANYFENDWKKLELYGNKFKSLTFFGKAIGQDSSIKVYVQYQGERE